MRNETYEFMGGHELIIAVPETIKEYNDLAKRGDQAVLLDAIDHEAYHGTLGTARGAFVKAIEAETGLKRREIGTGQFAGEGDKRKEITKLETEKTYYKRICAEKGLDSEAAPFAHIAKAISVGGPNEVKFDPSVTRKQAGPKKLPEQYVLLAKQVVDQNQVNAVAKTYRTELGKDWTVDLEKTGDELVEAIGWAMREVKLAREKKETLESFLKPKK